MNIPSFLYLPDFKFSLVGDANYTSPNYNVKVLGKLTPKDLLKLYNSHQFYLQLSTSEGFPNSLGEAMACGCIPIGSAVGAIPEIIKDDRFLLKEKNFSKLNELVKSILSLDLKSLQKANSSIIHQEYSLSRRKQDLIAAITN